MRVKKEGQRKFEMLGLLGERRETERVLLRASLGWHVSNTESSDYSRSYVRNWHVAESHWSCSSKGCSRIPPWRMRKRQLIMWGYSWKDGFVQISTRRDVEQSHEVTWLKGSHSLGSLLTIVMFTWQTFFFEHCHVQVTDLCKLCLFSVTFWRKSD